MEATSSDAVQMRMNARQQGWLQDLQQAAYRLFGLSEFSFFSGSGNFDTANRFRQNTLTAIFSYNTTSKILSCMPR